MNNVETQINQILTNFTNICFYTTNDINFDTNCIDFYNEQEKYNDISFSSIMSHSTFINNPKLFYSFIKEKGNLSSYKYNTVHKFIADCQFDHNITVITECIDSLHRQAGTIDVIEILGSIKNCYCQNCLEEKSFGNLLYYKNLPLCHCGGLIRPSCLLIQESVDGNALINSFYSLNTADRIIILGDTHFPTIFNRLFSNIDSNKILHIHKKDNISKIFNVLSSV